MLNRFVLSRKHDREASHIQLIPREFLFQRRSDGGLGIPSLEAHLKRQRLQLVLQFMTAAKDANHRAVKLVLPRTGGSNALDFLTISPLRHGDMIKWRLTSSWWRATWIWWYKIHWEITWHDLPSDERAWYGLRQPIWFHSDAALHYEQAARTHTSSAYRRCIGMVPEPQRSFRLHVSRVFGVKSLADFMCEGCAWPSQQDFVQRHLDFTLVSTTPGQQAKWLRVLYKEATQIVERLGERELVLQTPRAARRVIPHLGCKSGVKIGAASHRVDTSTADEAPSDDCALSTCCEEQIKSFVKHGKHLRKILLPIFEDLQFRLASDFCRLRARFWFLEAVHPRIQYCVRDECDAIETEEHLFFECTLAAQLGTRVRDEWEECEEVVHDAWHTLRAVTLHFIWTDRNRCLFDGRQPTPSLPALQVVFTTFAAHIRFFERRLYESEDKLALAKLKQLKRRPQQLKMAPEQVPALLPTEALLAGLKSGSPLRTVLSPAAPERETGGMSPEVGPFESRPEEGDGLEAASGNSESPSMDTGSASNTENPASTDLSELKWG
ncbi:hypothetical protein GQ600_23617 [Phytophthora cactorum]|nr:hypothetical protein GQ600_23617 [Phytophthora cactorum]